MTTDNILKYFFKLGLQSVLTAYLIVAFISIVVQASRRPGCYRDILIMGNHVYMKDFEEAAAYNTVCFVGLVLNLVLVLFCIALCKTFHSWTVQQTNLTNPGLVASYDHPARK